MRNRLFIAMVALALMGTACAGNVSSENKNPEAPIDAAGAPTEESQTTDDTPAKSSTPSVDVSEPTIQDSAESDGQSKSSDPAEPSDESTTTTRSTKEPERVPSDTTPSVTGETPADLLAQMIADAADRARVADSDVTVIRDEFVIWNDGSLGCAQPGQMYTQALVDGYWVVLAAGGADYDYRANTNGYWFLCEGGGLSGQPPSG